MSGLREHEPIVLDDDDDSQSGRPQENMPSTSGTQRQDDSDADSGDYVVEAIRGKRINKDTGQEEYLIKWQDWGEKDNTWEPIEHLKCEKLLQEFEEKQASKTKRRVSKPASAKRPRRATSSVDGSLDEEREKLFVESEDDDDDDSGTQRSRKDRTVPEPVGVKGFARGLNLESIISGVYGDHGKLFWFVKWVGEDHLEMVSNDELKQNAADELFKWYEKRLIWKNGIETETGDDPAN